MAADIGRVYPSEVHLLAKELEVQGELIEQERLERRADVTRLRMDVDEIKTQLESIQRARSITHQKRFSWTKRGVLSGVAILFLLLGMNHYLK